MISPDSAVPGLLLVVAVEEEVEPSSCVIVLLIVVAVSAEALRCEASPGLLDAFSEDLVVICYSSMSRDASAAYPSLPCSV